MRASSTSLVGVQELFTEGTRHLTWGSRRKRDNEDGDSEVRNKLSTCGVAVVGESNCRTRLSHVVGVWTSRDFCFLCSHGRGPRQRVFSRGYFDDKAVADQEGSGLQAGGNK